MALVEELVQDYRTHLQDLNVNSKSLINMLTILADNNEQHAPVIVEVIEDHIAKLDKEKRDSMYQLRKTWVGILPSQKLYKIDVQIYTFYDPCWPIKAPPPKQTGIHVYPKNLNPDLPGKEQGPCGRQYRENDPRGDLKDRRGPARGLDRGEPVDTERREREWQPVSPDKAKRDQVEEAAWRGKPVREGGRKEELSKRGPQDEVSNRGEVANRVGEPQPPVEAYVDMNDQRFRCFVDMSPEVSEEVVIGKKNYEIKLGAPPRRIQWGVEFIKVYVDPLKRSVIVDGWLMYKLGERVKEVQIRGRKEIIFYHGKPLNLWIEGQIYEVRVDSPPKVIFINDKPHRIQIDGRDMMILIDREEKGQYGGQPRFIFIDSESMEIRFDPLPRHILIDDKLCKLKLDMTQPCVNIEGKLHGIRFDGPPRDVFINGNLYKIFTDHAIKLRVGHRFHYVALGGPCHELIVDGKWFEVKFNEQAKEVTLGNTVLFVQLPGLPPEVKILPEVCPVEPMPIPGPPNGPPMQLVPGLRTMMVLPPAGMSPMSVPGPMMPPTSIPMGLPQPMMSVSGACKPASLPSSSSSLFPTAPAPSWPAVFDPMDISNLMARLVSTGILPNDQKPVLAGTATCGSAKKDEKKEKQEPVLPQECTSVKKKDWVQYEEIGHTEDQGKSSLFEQQQQHQVASRSWPTHPNIALIQRDPEGSTVLKCPPATGNDNDDLCDVCHEPFEQYWDDDNEQWHLRGAIGVNNKTFHPICYEDYTDVSEGTSSLSVLNSTKFNFSGRKDNYDESSQDGIPHFSFEEERGAIKKEPNSTSPSDSMVVDKEDIQPSEPVPAASYTFVTIKTESEENVEAIKVEPMDTEAVQSESEVEHPSDDDVLKLVADVEPNDSYQKTGILPGLDIEPETVLEETQEDIVKTEIESPPSAIEMEKGEDGAEEQTEEKTVEAMEEVSAVDQLEEDIVRMVLTVEKEEQLAVQTETKVLGKKKKLRREEERQDTDYRVLKRRLSTTSEDSSMSWEILNHHEEILLVAHKQLREGDITYEQHQELVRNLRKLMHIKEKMTELSSQESEKKVLSAGDEDIDNGLRNTSLRQDEPNCPRMSISTEKRLERLKIPRLRDGRESSPRYGTADARGELQNLYLDLPGQEQGPQGRQYRENDPRGDLKERRGPARELNRVEPVDTERREREWQPVSPDKAMRGQVEKAGLRGQPVGEFGRKEELDKKGLQDEVFYRSPTSVDLNNLSTRLEAKKISTSAPVWAGIVAGVSANYEQGEKQEPVLLKEYASVKKKIQPKEDKFDEIPDMTGMELSQMKVLPVGAIQRMYTGVPCPKCCSRFTVKMYCQHLIWHFQQEKRDKEDTRVVRCRKWYYGIMDWLQYDNIGNTEDKAKSSSFEQQQNQMVSHSQPLQSQKELSRQLNKNKKDRRKESNIIQNAAECEVNRGATASGLKEPKKLKPTICRSNSMCSSVSSVDTIINDKDTRINLLEHYIPSHCKSSGRKWFVERFLSQYTYTPDCGDDPVPAATTTAVTTTKNTAPTTQPTKTSPHPIPPRCRRRHHNGPRREGRKTYKTETVQNDPYAKMLTKKVFSQELTAVLSGTTLNRRMMKELEEEIMFNFQKADPHRKYRDGTQKFFFTYILLDPRITKDLPNRCRGMGSLNAFNKFIDAMFYVGKGKNDRPYSHLQEAIRYKKDQAQVSKSSRKTRKILEIWSAGYGVVVLQCFQNVMSEEAFVREACMIETIGLNNLLNEKRSEGLNYVTDKYPLKILREFGAYLLQRALRILLEDGERQLSPEDIYRY